ncbi:hypothetical protein [Streptomyces sp. NPDC050538]|uniref:hypothetical protein n=1 Tax=Streptomyces sp. NPDC050538 TaxID=3365627 RepID=UPI0037A2765E
MISLQEHRAPGDEFVDPEDLAVAYDGGRMYLAAPEHGQPLDAPATDQRPGLFALDTPLNRIVVNWQ